MNPEIQYYPNANIARKNPHHIKNYSHNMPIDNIQKSKAEPDIIYNNLVQQMKQNEGPNLIKNVDNNRIPSGKRNSKKRKIPNQYQQNYDVQTEPVKYQRYSDPAKFIYNNNLNKNNVNPKNRYSEIPKKKNNIPTNPHYQYFNNYPPISNAINQQSDNSNNDYDFKINAKFNGPPNGNIYVKNNNRFSGKNLLFKNYNENNYLNDLIYNNIIPEDEIFNPARSKSINKEINYNNNYIDMNQFVIGNNNENKKVQPALAQIDLTKNEVNDKFNNRVHTPELIHNSIKQNQYNNYNNNQNNFNNNNYNNYNNNHNIYNNVNININNINQNNINNRISPKQKKTPSFDINLEENYSDKNVPKINYINNINKNLIYPRPPYTPQNQGCNIKNNNNNQNENTNKVPKERCFISYAHEQDPNKEYRESMEDYHCINPCLSKENPSHSLFAIFDGHSGNEVASFLSSNFSKFLSKEISKIKFTLNHKENSKNLTLAIKNSFELIDESISNNKNIKDDVGSTGTIIFFYRDKSVPTTTKRVLICANVGDSKGFLIKKNEIIQMTKDHTCKDKIEVERIRKQGGVVFQGRVFGTLMLTRSFGDKEMKKYGVMATPDCFSKQINEEDLFAVIASDGVWDVISQDDLFEMSKTKMSSEEFSKKIIKTAKERETRDNVSCIVIKLNIDNK